MARKKTAPRGTPARKAAGRKGAARKVATRQAATKPAAEKAVAKPAAKPKEGRVKSGAGLPADDWRFELIVSIKSSALRDVPVTKRRSFFQQALKPLAADFNAGRLFVPWTYVTANPPEGSERLGFAVLRLVDPALSLEYVQDRLVAADSPVEYVERNAALHLASTPPPQRAAAAPQRPRLVSLSTRPTGVQTSDRYSRWQWALTTIGADQIQDVPPPGGTTIVAIVDSGLRRPDGTLPPDIDPNIVLPAGQCTPPSVGWPYNNVDKYGHGTMLAGTIAAATGNNLGIASPVPASWNAAHSIKLMPVQFFDVGAQPSVTRAVAAIDYARTVANVKVITCAWHVGVGGGRENLELRRAIKAASDQRIVVVAAAGNDGVDNGIYPTYPANYGNRGFDGHVPGLKVLSVAATGRDDFKAGFSNYSRPEASTTGTSLVDIAAPGLHLYTTGRSFTGPRYQLWNGTSAAAALGSAAAALVYALNPGWSADEVQQYLKDAADKKTSLLKVCQDGNRLSVANALLPLEVTAPVHGEQVPSGQNYFITWRLKFPSAMFNARRVSFDLERWNAGTAQWEVVRNLGTSPINAANHVWQVRNPGDVGARCRLRLTTRPSAQLNFTVTSDEFAVT